LTVDNQIDTTTGTVKVKAVFDNKDGALFPNQFVNVRLILEQRPNTIVIPAAAMLSGSQGNFVYLVKPGEPPADLQAANRPAGAQGGGKAGRSRSESAGKGAGAGAGPGGQKQDPYYVEARTVTLDLTEGSQVILSGGVKAGDVIVVDGQEKLRNGSRVNPRQAANPNGPRAVNPNRADSGVGAPTPRDADQPKSGPPNTDQQQAQPRRAGGQQP